MKISSNKRKLITSFFCLSTLFVALGVSATTKKNNNMTNTFANPDFAFPATVKKNATTELSAALKSGDALKTLQAAIQLDVSDGLVDAQTYRISLERFDSLSRELPVPYNSLALMLEATLYRDIYLSNSWNFNKRVLPLNPKSADVLEWSRDQFADTVLTLVSRSLADQSALARYPLSDIVTLLTGADDAVKAGFTVADFMSVRATDVLGAFVRENRQVIPFGNADSKSLAGSDPVQAVSLLRLDLLDNAVMRHAGDANKQLETLFCDMKLQCLSGQERTDYLGKCLERFRFTPWGASFVVDYCGSMTADNDSDRNVVARRKYDMLTSYRNAFPDAPRIGEVDEALDALLAKNVNVSFPSQIQPGKPVKVSVSGANVYDFYLLAYRINGTDRVRRVKYSELSSSGSPILAIPVKLKKESPDEFSEEVDIPSLSPGLYTFVPSSTAKSSGLLTQNPNNTVALALVSDLSVITSAPLSGKDGALYVVSAFNQKPVSGAKVTFTPRKNGKNGTPVVKTSDKDGKVAYANGDYDYLVQSDGNFITGHIYSSYENAAGERVTLGAGVLTDLSIYRPGQKVQFSVVAYTERQKILNMATDRKLRIMLADANGQEVDSLLLATDKFGRVDGSFLIPDAGLLGRWGLHIYDNTNPAKPEWLTAESFEVADYKSPTFYAGVTSSTTSYKAGDIMKFSGVAMTYAGMPVDGGKVAYSVSYLPMWRISSMSDASYGGETVTGADGSFSIELPTDGLVGTGFAFGRYVLKVTVTNVAGETQEAPALRFSLGNAFRIETTLPDAVEVSAEPHKFNVTVRDLSDHPVKRKVYYELGNDGEIFRKGDFESPEFPLELDDVRSGRYAVRFSLTPDFKDSDECKVVTDSVTFWRIDDVKPPVATPLWVPVNRITAAAGAKSVKVRLGSSYPDSWILAQICTDMTPVITKWIKVSQGVVELPVDVPSENLRAFVELLGMRDLNMCRTRVTVVPYEQSVPLNIEQHTFRESIEPGSRQSWRFRLSLSGVPAADMPVMAVMTNKALNAIVPFEWHFDPYGSVYRSPVSSLGVSGTWTVGNSGYFSGHGKRYGSYSFVAPSWNLYGYSLYSGNNVMDLMSMKTMGVRGANKFAAVQESVRDAVADSDAAGGVIERAPACNSQLADERGAGAEEEVCGNGGYGGNGGEVQLRDVECPLAFFKPDIAADADGMATIDFTAPQFIGTWQLQVLGYTPQMKGAVLTLDSRSAKQVMVQMNAPRFVRAGDMMQVSATVFNSSDVPRLLSGRITLIDAASGSVLESKDYGLGEVAASGSEVAMLSFDVPVGINAMQIVAYAYSDGCSDGEQTVVPVLPSSLPVIESTPFYIRAGADDFSMELPTFGSDDKVSLSYCDNPVWECVTALPDMLEPKSVNVLSKAYALFGNAVASSLFCKYPQLMDSVKAMAADSVLVSDLQSDEQLKSVLLNNTPWVNDARSETLRMQSLIEYADTEKAKGSVMRMLKGIGDAQLPDGGWGWCPDMEPSSFITGSVLHILASLKNMNCLPKEGENMARKAFKYMDNEFAREWNESKRKYLPVSTLLSYLYDKSAFAGVGFTPQFKQLNAAAMTEFKSGWRNFSVSDKAIAAILMKRTNEVALARTLLESLHQYASVSDEKGMWFANMSGSRSGTDEVLATAKVLEAYAEIEPSSVAVDQLRQWLVISKQTQNWGDSRMTAAAIHALLAAGSDWAVDSQLPSVKLNGTPVALPYLLPVSGSFVIDLDPSAASGATLEVNRNGQSPAWGGVVSSSVAPILDVKEVCVPQLSIKKSVYAVSENGKRKSAADVLKKGDRVRVTLTIVCDRNLDYVAVTDPRAACLEPAIRMSGYTSSDGVWYYQEIRNAQTNLFIPYLSKGTHMISYECFVDRVGVYTSGVAEAQSQYAPVIVAHSAGSRIEVSD